jgi:hypothetical protein
VRFGDSAVDACGEAEVVGIYDEALHPDVSDRRRYGRT